MKEYEITYISNPQLDEDARGELDAAVDNQIASLKGSLSESSPSNRKRLAYPINDQAVGFVRSFSAQINPEKIAGLQKILRKMEGVLRLTIIQSHLRSGVSPDIVAKLTQQKQSKSDSTAAKQSKPRKPAKPVTMKEVEEKIEEALDEEVK